MTYRINFEHYKDNFVLPSSIIPLLTQSTKIHLQVILIIFSNPNKHYSPSLLATLLQVNEKEIHQSLSFWVQQNILLSEQIQTNIPTVEKLISKPAHPLTPGDHIELGYLIDHMQLTLERSLTSTDIKSITHLFEHYRMPIDVLLMAIQYAVQSGHKDMRYIEKICIGWYDRGIITHDQAEQFLLNSSQSKQFERQIKRLFGIDQRKLIESEQRMIDQWFNEFHCDEKMIKLAYERTIKHTGKVVFAYTHKILSNWHEQGFTSIEDVLNNEQPKSTHHNSSENRSFNVELLDKFWNTIPTMD